ncbi:hypothetical protein [Streptomyces sp. S.PB5]|uniref:hypothetical protein n=1 Tax=Streptomyces sp. S.PB5 TaxID=3020844 RepID=UPI0025B04A09|nr:hypothetical protein [Streptomyces sp. S.PB5]MDN3028671.1 hypothetical protein [Streptomyces sp. S.PB5]
MLPKAASAFRDPWEPSGGVGGNTHDPDTHDPQLHDVHTDAHTHDPHEVTVQLDAVVLRADGRIEGQGGGNAPDGSDGSDCSDGPVFVDESGRRSRRFRRIGIFVGIACAIYAMVIVGTLLSGNSNAPWLPVPGQGEGKEAGQVENSPLPTDTAEPTTAGSHSPGVSPSAGSGTAPSAGASATAPGASATTTNPSGSADPKPTATKTTSGTGTNPTPDPEGPTGSPTSSPDPTPTEDAPPTPTQTQGGDSAGTGTDTVADGVNDSSVGTTTPAPENTV